MAVHRINAALATLKFPPAAQVQALRDTTMFVCRATRDEWSAYVQSEDGLIKANKMAWFGPEAASSGRSAGEIHIVEYPTTKAHAAFVSMLIQAIQSDAGVMRCLTPGLDSSNTQGPQYQPDASFGPKRSVMERPGIPLPAGIPSWDDFVTLKIEIGVSQSWGEGQGRLDWKARRWAEVPGVAYVLCIRVDEDRQDATYKWVSVCGYKRAGFHEP